MTCARSICTNFNPRPPCGRRQKGFRVLLVDNEFQPTSPVRETTPGFEDNRQHRPISTHVPRAGDDVMCREVRHGKNISTHVPRAGDDDPGRDLSGAGAISTHVPRAGDDRRSTLIICG